MNEIVYVSATELARAIRAKEVSSEEVVDVYLERIEKVNPKINALVQLEQIWLVLKLAKPTPIWHGDTSKDPFMVFP